MAEATAALGDIDILVNNAGISPTGRAENFKREAWDEAIAMNLTAPMMLAQRVARRLIEPEQPGPDHQHGFDLAAVASSVYRLSAYAATKAALANLTRQLAVEWARLRNSGQRDRARMDSDRGHRRRNRQAREKERMEAFTPMARLGRRRRNSRRGDLSREPGLQLRDRRGCGRWRLQAW